MLRGQGDPPPRLGTWVPTRYRDYLTALTMSTHILQGLTTQLVRDMPWVVCRVRRLVVGFLESGWRRSRNTPLGDDELPTSGASQKTRNYSLTTLAFRRVLTFTVLAGTPTFTW